MKGLKPRNIISFCNHIESNSHTFIQVEYHHHQGIVLGWWVGAPRVLAGYLRRYPKCYSGVHCSIGAPEGALCLNLAPSPYCTHFLLWNFKLPQKVCLFITPTFFDPNRGGWLPFGHPCRCTEPKGQPWMALITIDLAMMFNEMFTNDNWPGG